MMGSSEGLSPSRRDIESKEASPDRSVSDIPERERASSKGTHDRSPSPRHSRPPSRGSRDGSHHKTRSPSREDGYISPRSNRSPSRDSRSPSPLPRDQSPRDSRDGSRRRTRSFSRDREMRDVSPPRRDRSFSRDSRDASPPRRNFRDDSLPPRDRSPDAPRPREHSPLPRRPAPAQRGTDRYRPAPRERTPPPAPPVKTEEEKLADARAEYQKLLNLRSQGVYLPPQKLRALQAAITDRSSKEYQRMAWEALKKSINGLVNKVNTANIKFVVPELFGENLIRGRGLFCQSLLKAQHASLPFTPIYACLAAICNTKLPQVGELLIKRLIVRFRKAFKRNDKAVCLSSTMFIAHLVNNQVVHEMLAAQILLLLLQKPTDDSVEIAVGLMKEVGLFLEEMSPPIAHAVFDQFRNILHEADIDKRTQYMIEVLFQVRKDKYKDNPVIKEELDLVEEEDQITHRIGLDDEITTQDTLNIFKFDPDWEANEEEYKKLKAEILGEGSGDEDDEDGGSEESESEDEEEQQQKAIEIKDQSNADLVNLRRTIYLSIQSSANPEEAAHKLMKLRLPAGQEPELVSMIVETCAQEKVYTKFMGILGERFARLNRMWMELFEESFVKYYTTIHRYETNKLRNIARFWGHQLANDAVGWHVLSIIHLNEEETTSASRIFIKILFEDLQENMGSAKLKARLGEEMLKPSLEGIFPHDNPRNIRFSINYFTSIKMGFLTDEMREFLANIPKPALPAPAADSDSESVSSYSSYSSYSSRSRSRSRTPPRKALDRGRSYSRSPPRRTRDDSYSRSRSRSRSYSRSVSRRSYSRSPVRQGGRDDRSISRSPVRRSRSYSRSPSRSRSPTPNRARGRSYSRSVSPDAGPSTKRRRDDSYSRSRSRSRSVRRTRSPPGPPPPPQRLRDDSVSSRGDRSPPARKQRRVSRSPSPVRRDARPRRSSYSRSRSRSPVRGGASRAGKYRQRDSPPPPPSRGGGGARGRSASYSRSRSPPARGSGGGAIKREDRSLSRSRSRTRSRSRSPVKKGSSPVGGNKRRRGYSSDSRSRSPPPPRAKRGRVEN
ncbi:putative pre-mRNA-splicing factor cwc-22 [Cladorrhinum sp. PSN332]|nr:putative pre-mRNA-splicing factor cwc-22 [Cladorrhinum sp. PSN332]